MDYIQILIVHSRGVYNFVGMILVAHVSFLLLLLLCILFKNELQILTIFKPYTVVKEIPIKKTINANECVR